VNAKEIVVAKFDPETLVGVEMELYQKAVGFIKSYNGLKTEYREIFRLVRENDVAPNRVDLILGAAGFNAQRASEMRRIAATDEATAKVYLSGQIGFKAVLEIERARKPAKSGKGRKTSAVSKRGQAIFFALAKYAKTKGAGPRLMTFQNFAVLVVNMDEKGGILKAASGVTVNTNKLQFENYESTKQNPS